MAGGRLVAQDEASGRWHPIGAPWDDDLLAFLAGGADARDRAATLIAEGAPIEGEPAGLPFTPRSLRAFMLWERHFTTAARTMVRRFMPTAVGLVADAWALTGRVFPPLQPGKRFHEVPVFYMGNHTAIGGAGETIDFRGTACPDFELELGMVLAHAVSDPTGDQALAAIGGFFVLNDWSARDVQFRDERTSPFGGVVKAKSFATSIGPVVVTPDEVLGRLEELVGEVHVNGEHWSTASGAGPTHDLGAMVAYAAAGETLAPGDVLSTGTLPGGCGLELNRFLTDGDEVTLHLEGVGTLTNRVRVH